MKKIFTVVFYIFSFCISMASVEAETDYIYFKDDVIHGVTTRTEFKANEVEIRSNRGNYFILENSINLGNSFIKTENLKITSSEDNVIGNKIYFKDKNGKFDDKIKFDLQGILIFDWSKSNRIKKIKIGKIYNESGKVEKQVYLNFNEIEIIHSLKIKVEENMYLGRVIAGEELSTEKSINAHPARVSFQGEKGKSIKITIPELAEIKNEANDILKVNLWFRENKNQELKKEFKESKNNQGIINDVLIDGKANTTKDSFGRYKGVFIVRVEYEDED